MESDERISSTAVQDEAEQVAGFMVFTIITDLNGLYKTKPLYNTLNKRDKELIKMLRRTYITWKENLRHATD